ncbi:hypothetical protein ACA910_009529 [Epithemia clementina (nom. ined.)]
MTGITPTTAATVGRGAVTTHHNKTNGASSSSQPQQPQQVPQPPSLQNDDEEYEVRTMDMTQQLRQEALEALKFEPELCSLLHRTVLAPGVESFEDAVAATVCHRLLQDNHKPSNSSTTSPVVFCPNSLKTILAEAMYCPDHLEMGHTMADAVRRDALAVLRRDPACQTLLEVVLFYKGFAALVCHRAARQKWMQALPRRSMTALFLQSQASALFGVDIHPATTIGAGIMLDHGTGIVLGETATVGDGCTLLHGVTLGGTCKQKGDRHPKVGNNVLIGAGASILGNIRIGHGCKIGAGSIVLRPIPDGATAVGAPAKIIGRALEAKPGSFMDDTLQKVALLHKSESMSTLGTLVESSIDSSSTTTITAKNNNNNERDDTTTTTTTWTHLSSTPSLSLPITTRRQRPRRKSDADVETSSSSSSSSSSDSSTAIDDPHYLCPYRGYRKIKAPATAITYCVLQQWLRGCTSTEIGNVFFALDTRNVGYVYWDDFIRDAPAILQNYVTSLDHERIQTLLDHATTIMHRASTIFNTTSSTGSCGSNNSSKEATAAAAAAAVAAAAMASTSSMGFVEDNNHDQKEEIKESPTISSSKAPPPPQLPLPTIAAK